MASSNPTSAEICSVYENRVLEGDMPLAQEAVTVSALDLSTDEYYSFKATIRVAVKDSPARFCLDFKDIDFGEVDDREQSLRRFLLAGLPLDITNETFKCSGRIDTHAFDERVSGVILGPEVEKGTQHKLQRVTFHVANYNAIPGRPAGVHRTPGDSDWHTRAEQLVLVADGWRIALRPHLHHDASENRRTNDSEPLLNGIGMISRQDGSDFTPQSAKELIAALDYFLSFLFMHQSRVILCVGSNATDVRSWELWRTPSATQQRAYNLRTWAPNYREEDISRALAGFLARWRDSAWQEPLKLSIDWLLTSGRLARQQEDSGAIAFSQIPLEMVAWMIFVDESEIINSGEFDRLSAESKFQLLLARCQVSFQVPSELHSLRILASKTSFTNGPKLLAKIRNMIIHPTRKNREFLQSWNSRYGIDISEVFYESRLLFQHYLVLSLLFVIGYRGKYNKYLRVIADEEFVPWSKPD